MAIPELHPDWTCVRDIDLKDVAWRNEAALDASGRRCAGGVEGGLSDGVATGEEFEDHRISCAGSDGVWAVDEFPTITNFDGVHCRECGGEEKEKEGKRVHLDVD